MKNRIHILAGLVMALCGCSGEPVLPAVEDVLKSIQTSVKEIEMEDGGSFDVEFSVVQTGYVFDYNVLSRDCQVHLECYDGTEPTAFSLTGISKRARPGLYKATLTDNQTAREYDVACRLTLTAGQDKVETAMFRVRKVARGGDKEKAVATGLPVITLNTAGPILSKTEWVSGQISIDGIDAYPDLAEMACEVRGRGNTTWMWPKKPYTLRLESKTSVLGMPRHKRWVLLSNFIDRTLQRNLLAFHIGATLSNLAWTPRYVPVELVLNGIHYGQYLLTEQIRVDDNRVNITEMEASDNAGEAVTGGYLLELDFHFDNEIQWKDHGIPFAVKYPDEEDITPEQIAYIQKYVAQAAEALYGDDFCDPEKGYAAWIDTDSFVEYWLVNEVMGNHELGNPGSVFMHKDRGGKLVAGPIWDFDFGTLSYKVRPDMQTSLVNISAYWYNRLFQDPAFRAKVLARFEQMLPALEQIPDFMARTEKDLQKSAIVNFSIWNPADDGIINDDETLTYGAACERLRAIFRERLNIMSTELREKL